LVIEQKEFSSPKHAIQKALARARTKSGRPPAANPRALRQGTVLSYFHS
jgi:hypothetical protein